MGRHDFRPLSVHRLATQMMEAGRIDRKSAPPWYDTVGRIPPSQALVRTQPLPHRKAEKRSKPRRPSKLFKPQPITYEEDTLRKEFFGDHPWELARPRMVIENDGKDSYNQDWSRIRSPNQPFNGENVVQRQMWLMRNEPGITKAEAYDRARREFYDERLQEDTERRVAKEEAMYTGAQFGPSTMEIGMKLEDEEYARWRTWAEKEAEALEQKRAAMYTGTNSGDIADAEPEEAVAALEEMSDKPLSQAAAGSTALQA